MLSEDQERSYQEAGYLLVAGLIPEHVSAAAAVAMWAAIGARPDDPATWAEVARAHQAFESTEVLACYTPAYLAAAAQLTGEEPESKRPPIDHAIQEHGHKTFPRAFRIAAMTFLSDVAPHGGGTVVWPGSHRQLEALARSDPSRYELMWTLNQRLREIDLGEPVELTPRRGDVLFYHYLCAHAGSKNVSDQPRLALNMKW